MIVFNQILLILINFDAINLYFQIVVDIYCLLVNNMCMSNFESPVLTLQECSAYLKIAESTIYLLARNGKLPCQKVGRNWRFNKEALDRWLMGDVTLVASES